MESIDPDELERESSDYPEGPVPVLETFVDIYHGVERATDVDRRGRSRTMVQQYAGREDLTSNEIGFRLRASEIRALVVRDGNRWRVADAE